jgi:hypothetical protein
VTTDRQWVNARLNVTQLFYREWSAEDEIISVGCKSLPTIQFIGRRINMGILKIFEIIFLASIFIMPMIVFIRQKVEYHNLVKTHGQKEADAIWKRWM